VIAFSLNQEIDPQRLIHSISKLVEKNVSSRKDAESSVLVISIRKVTEYDEVRKIEEKTEH